MNYRTPKVLEKKPIVMGLDLKMVVVCVLGIMLFLFTIFTYFFVAFIFPIISGGYLMVCKKYSGKKELVNLIKFQSGIKCIHINKSIKDMVKNTTPSDSS